MPADTGKGRVELEAHLLLGIVAKIDEQYDEALQMFRGALYVNATCWLAHYYLADIYFSQQDVTGAHREYGIALKLLRSGVSKTMA